MVKKIIDGNSKKVDYTVFIKWEIKLLLSYKLYMYKDNKLNKCDFLSSVSIIIILLQ